MSLFESLDELASDPILGITENYLKDPREKKVNLGVGVYRDQKGHLSLMSAVSQAEALIAKEKKAKNYLPISGNKNYLSCLESLIFGDKLPLYKEKLTSIQTLGGTGALHLGAKILKKALVKTVAGTNPTWPNHPHIFQSEGFNYTSCSYYDMKNKKLLFKEYCRDLSFLEEGSVVLLHACCHNPSGSDLTLSQFKEISDIIKEKKLIPFFDAAYLGFDSSFYADASAIRLFAKEGHLVLIALSLSKNFGLYGERVGALFILSENATEKKIINSQLDRIARAIYSNPPLHGALIVEKILSDPNLTSIWQEELKAMNQRIKDLRSSLVKGLEKNTASRYSYLKQEKGIFSFLPLSEEQVVKLQEKFGIYMAKSGRINIAALNDSVLEYVLEALLDAL